MPDGTGHVLVSKKRFGDGAFYEAQYACSCGEVVSNARGRDLNAVTIEAQRAFDEHAAQAGAAEKVATGQTIGALVVLAVLVAVVCVGATKLLGGSDEGPTRDDAPGQSEQGTSDEWGAGLDCDKSVASLMRSLYGSTLNWPEGEYPERVAQCKGE